MAVQLRADVQLQLLMLPLKCLIEVEPVVLAVWFFAEPLREKPLVSLLLHGNGGCSGSFSGCFPGLAFFHGGSSCSGRGGGVDGAAAVKSLGALGI